MKQFKASQRSMLVGSIGLLVIFLIPAFVLPRLLVGESEVPHRENNGFGFAVQVTVGTAEENLSYQGQLEHIATRFARQFLVELKKFSGPAESNIWRRPYPIKYVLTNEEMAEELDSRFKHDLQFNGGFYDPNRHRIVLMHANKERFDRDLMALTHEITHLMLDVLYPGADFSLWFNEGLAVDNELGGDDKKVMALVKNMVKRRATIPVSRLIQATSEDYQSEGNLFFYYQGYAFTRFLKELDGRLFATYFQAEAQTGSISPTALERIYKLSAEELDAAFKE